VRRGADAVRYGLQGLIIIIIIIILFGAPMYPPQQLQHFGGWMQ
jgi:hypothetical protein